METLHPRQRLLPVARGDQPADLLLKNGRVVNVFSGEVVEANVAVVGEHIAGVGDYAQAKQTIDLGGMFVVPGFIDAHMHIESTMLPPAEFARLALPHGTTTVVADPHEIANVLGLDGIRYMMASAAQCPLNVVFMLPSCVPATNMETSGATLTAADLAPLMDDARVGGLAEMMNYPGAILGDAGVLAKLALGDHKRIDGHAPGVTGRWLQAYAAAGITTDHESTTLAEAREKLRAGLRVLIREGSAAKNLDALAPLVTAENAHRFCFCTDDRHPEDLVHEGHIDHVIRRAIARGIPPVRAIQMATLFPAQQYGLSDRGAVAPGYRADLCALASLEFSSPVFTLCGGHNVKTLLGASSPVPPPRSAVTLPRDLSLRSFAIPFSGAGRARVIDATFGQITTGCAMLAPRTAGGFVVADMQRDILKLAVIERHHGTGNIGLGLVRGFGFKYGAIASTVAHDSHNLLVLGTNDADMLVAARAVAEAGGGQAAARDGKPLAVLPLPIAGLMSDQPFEIVAKQQAALRQAAASLGTKMPDPFMTLSFLSLPVIPSLKLTDRGLVDVSAFTFVPLAVAD